ncbi:CHAT domain-containing protein [Endothiovibrio diazotrophicus]
MNHTTDTGIRTVSLELLRHGPPHNQLLSPLTRYLALCGDYGAATVEVPYEHRPFLERLRTLRYRTSDRDGDDAHRHEVIEQTAGEMAGVLETVHGLIPELNHHSGETALVNLELVLSAAELAMLPFELSKVPRGCKGGEGGWLSLQKLAPVAITRRVRSVNHDHHEWNRTPRILFAHADGEGLDGLAHAHLQCLVAALRPWFKYFDPTDDEAVKAELGKHITVIGHASVERIAEACARTEYTHVHLLAHGDIDPKRRGERFGLRLHHSREGFEVVGGDRLANILGGSHTGCFNDTPKRRPLVVTVAGCDSANVGDVVYDGASIAHDLHRAGIPLVVASQFPLTFKGSVVMVQELYHHLLCGLDPRLALHKLRGRLYAAHGAEVHDWAALVGYAALPADIDEQLLAFRFQQAKGTVDAALDRMDRTLDRYRSETLEEHRPSRRMERSVNLPRGESAPAAATTTEKEVRHCVEVVENAIKRLPEAPGYAVETLGYKGAVEKRIAETWFEVARNEEDPDRQEALHERSLESLEHSRRHYDRAARAAVAQPAENRLGRKPLHWSLTQLLSLNLILGEAWNEANERRWQAALFSVDTDLDSADREHRMWAHGSAVELWLLRYGFSDDRPDAACEQVQHHTEQLLRLAEPEEFVLYSSARQLRRYEQWWGSMAFSHPITNAPLWPLAGDMANRLCPPKRGNRSTLS